MGAAATNWNDLKQWREKKWSNKWNEMKFIGEMDCSRYNRRSSLILFVSFAALLQSIQIKQLKRALAASIDWMNCIEGKRAKLL